MKTIKQLMQLMSTNEITYSICPLPEDVMGYYQGDLDGDYILINEVLEDDYIKHKCVLAEEVGHYFTTIGVNEPLESITYRKLLLINRQEEKALKWAIDYLIDTDVLLQYLSSDISASLEDLIDYFEVTNDYMIQKLHLMAREKLYWHIRDKHYLCLSNLPSIYIATFFDDSMINKI